MAFDRPYSVLFLSTGNSACSILAKAVVNKLADGGFIRYSAGSLAKGAADPEALKAVAEMGFDPAEFRSRSWDEFASPGAPEIDFIVKAALKKRMHEIGRIEDAAVPA